MLRQNADARQARFRAGASLETETDQRPDNKVQLDSVTGSTTNPMALKRDFFGRIIEGARHPSKGEARTSSHIEERDVRCEDRRVWVSFHEGFSNAVRKPITLEELMKGF